MTGWPSPATRTSTAATGGPAGLQAPSTTTSVMSVGEDVPETLVCLDGGEAYCGTYLGKLYEVEYIND